MGQQSAMGFHITEALGQVPSQPASEHRLDTAPSASAQVGARGTQTTPAKTTQVSGTQTSSPANPQRLYQEVLKLHLLDYHNNQQWTGGELEHNQCETEDTNQP